MSFLVQRQVGPRHVQHSAYDTPEEALDAATTLMTQGAMSVHIIDPSDHVFTPHRFANQVRRQRGGGIKSLGHRIGRANRGDTWRSFGVGRVRPGQRCVGLTGPRDAAFRDI